MELSGFLEMGMEEEYSPKRETGTEMGIILKGGELCGKILPAHSHPVDNPTLKYQHIFPSYCLPYYSLITA
ncbi:hypothetical protein A2U01_0099787 [Trifolium medium]|uniref:Uncharacterized protein n=1 Tax=Trifolium medium TaxID=97028 RepID=A0A392URR1_9FABA|nr:hypothetical protein [Trifolium medium]